MACGWRAWLPSTRHVRSDCAMSKQLTLAEFIEALAGEPISGTPQDAFRVMTAPEFFVAPRLVVKSDLGELDSEIILVSARGSAGKSTTAKYLSAVLDCPLWLLEKDSAVGATSLSLKLARYFSNYDPESVVAGMDRPTILIDSLDEARSRISGTSWSEFLESLFQYSSRGARLVLLGRERTLEEVWLTLADAGARLAWLEISHFGREDRLHYVDSKVEATAKDRSIVAGAHYVRARDAIIQSLAGSLSNNAADAFVGYAPVLDAVATVLSTDDNLFSLVKHFDAAQGGTRGLVELRSIIDRLLKREQTKVAPLANDLGLAESLVYTPDEQIGWLCADLLHAPQPDLSHIGDAQAQSTYRKQLRGFLEDHPFRSGDRWASTVFAAYVANRRFADSSGEDLLRIGDESGLLFDFFSLDGARAEVDELQFAALHASIVAGAYSDVRTALSMTEVAEGEYEVAVRVERPGDPVNLQLALIAADTSELCLYGPLESLTVESSQTVRIPARQPVTVLGPDLFIHCAGLVIEGASVEFAHRAVPVDGRMDSGQVILEVTGKLQLPHEIARAPLPGDFELSVPNSTILGYPWIDYRTDLGVVDEANPSGRAERFLNMLMNLTRNHGHDGDRGCFIMKLQGRQSVKGEEFTRVVAALEDIGVVRLEKDIIYLTPTYEPHRFSGKASPGQRVISDVWDVWSPVATQITANLRE